MNMIIIVTEIAERMTQIILKKAIHTPQNLLLLELHR